MHCHLYSRSKTCNGILHDVELTDEIKRQIIENRLYHEPKPIVNPNITTIINNLNQQRNIINVINTFDIGKKITALANRDGVEILELDDLVEQLYGKSAKRLQTNAFKHDVEYDDSNFKDMVSKITQQEDLMHSSVFFDTKKDRFLFATGTNEWDTMRVKPGLELIIDSLEKYHLSHYEVYLIRKIELNQRARLDESLDKYYAFMATFNVLPFVRGKADANILYNEGDANYVANGGVHAGDVNGHQIVDKYNARYVAIKNGLSEAKKNATYKEVLDIVHQNIQNNLETINQRIAELIQVEPDFLEEIRPRRRELAAEI